jgi:hypothetical protein
MSEKSQSFVDQLLEKTREGKISWTTAFEDGQFKTVLPGGQLAFVVQVKGDARRILMLDERQEAVLDETITKAETEGEPEHHPKIKLYAGIGELQDLARSQALQVNVKLVQAEQLLNLI